ncbi:MAG: hypothetical protein ACYS47_02280 [Planctomycetota bacterium]|jgi:hypothetical protein
MGKRISLSLLLGGLLLAASGCRAFDTFNAYRRISVLPFTVVPHKAGRVAPVSLNQLQEASVRHLRANTLFDEVGVGQDGRPDTVYVQGTIINYRQHRIGKAVVTMFTGVDIRGDSLIDYRFFDSAGRILLTSRIRARFMRAAAGMDPTAEAAGYELSRVASWHKSMRTVHIPPPH